MVLEPNGSVVEARSVGNGVNDWLGIRRDLTDLLVGFFVRRFLVSLAERIQIKTVTACHRDRCEGPAVRWFEH